MPIYVKRNGSYITGTPYVKRNGVYVSGGVSVKRGGVYVSASGGGATAPGAPTIGTATAGDGSVSVTFTAPASNGGSAILDYQVLLSTGQTATGASSPISVTAPNGTPVTATVRARNAAGYGAYSAASNSVMPSASGTAPITKTAVRLSALGDFYEVPDGAFQDLPNSSWTVGVWHRCDTPTTGANLRTILANGASGSQRLTLGLSGPGGVVPGGFQGAIEYASGSQVLRGDTNRVDGKWRLMLTTYDPIKSLDSVFFYSGIENGAVRLEGSTSVTPATISPASALRFGSVVTGATAANQFIGDISQAFVFKGRLTDVEMSRLLQGHDIINDLGKTATVFDFASAAATVMDRSGTLTATRNGSGITTVAGPTFQTAGTVAMQERVDGRVLETSAAAPTVRDVPLLVSYSGAPATIEARVVVHGTTTEVKPWTVIASAPTAAPTGAVTTLTLPAVPQGDIAGGKAWYNFEIRASGATVIQDVAAKPRTGIGAVVVDTGQSNAANKYANVSSGNPAASPNVTISGSTPVHNGSIALANAIAAGVNYPVMIVNTSMGGSSLLSSTQSAINLNWENTTTGGLYDQAIKKLNFHAEGDWRMVAWDQGEADGTTVPIDGAAYKAAELALAARFRAACGRTASQMMFGSMITGASTSTKAGIDASMSTIRQAKIDNAGTAGYMLLGSATDLVMNDMIHSFTPEYRRRGRRYANGYLKWMAGSAAQAAGPRLTSMVKSGSTATVTVTNSVPGAALITRSPGARPPSGFTFTDGSGALTVTAFSFPTASTMLFTFNRAVVGTLNLAHQQTSAGGTLIPLSISAAPLHTTSGSPNIVIDMPGNNLTVGDLVNVVAMPDAGNFVPANVGGIYVGAGPRAVIARAAGTITIAADANATSTADGGLSPILGVRYMNDVLDNSSPGGDDIGLPLLPGVLTA